MDRIRNEHIGGKPHLKLNCQAKGHRGRKYVYGCSERGLEILLVSERRVLTEGTPDENSKKEKKKELPS